MGQKIRETLIIKLRINKILLDKVVLNKARIKRILVNKGNINKLFLINIFMMLFLSSGLSATNLILSFSQNATDNLFQTRFAEKDYLSSLAFSLDVPISPFSFFTEGEYYYLYRNTDISYYAQNLGLDYLYALSEKTALYTGAKIGGNLYRSSFSDFNYFDWGVLASIKSYLTPESILKLDYSLDYKRYKFSSFDNLSHLVTLNLDRYFQTKTTLKVGITWGYKRFIHPLAVITSSAITLSSEANAIATTATKAFPATNSSSATNSITPQISGPATTSIPDGSSSQVTTSTPVIATPKSTSPILITSETMTNATMSSTNNLGKGYKGYQMGRRGSYFQSEISEDEREIQILSLSGLIAQGLGDRIGLRFSATRQWTLSGRNPFNSIEEYYLVENPSYDLYTWNGYLLSGLLTVEAPANWQLKLGYTWSSKVFPGIDAMDLTGSSLGFWREDRRSLWEARIEKDFASFSIILSYAYAKNSSNDYLFEWRSHFLSLGIDWNLSWGTSQ